MERKIIFVGGIHGVGKTTLCKKIEEITKTKHYSSSQLIQQSKKSQLDSKSKVVKDINNNQDILLSAIERYTDKGATILLDGHFCLLSQNFEITRIPKETFSAISPIAIVVLHDSVESINTRIRDRDSVEYGVKMLMDFQNAEISYAKEIAKDLGVPDYLHSVSDTTSKLTDFIYSLTDKEGK